MKNCNSHCIQQKFKDNASTLIHVDQVKPLLYNLRKLDKNGYKFLNRMKRDVDKFIKFSFGDVHEECC